MLVVNILTQILFTLFTFFDLQIFRKKKYKFGLFGVIYYVNFQFTPWKVING